MTTVVVDASVAVKWFVSEVRSDEADALSSAGLTLVAPLLIRYEVANAFSKKVRAGFVTVDHAVEYLALLPRFLKKLIESDELLPESIALSLRLDHPIHDCLYVEAARRRDAFMVTDDATLLRKLRGQDWAGFAVALGDWRAVVT